MKERPGDQRLPKLNGARDCQETLLERLQVDLPARREVGIERYGTGLQPLNGRDIQRDVYEEWLDLGTYLEQWRRERTTVLSVLAELVNTPADEVALVELVRERARQVLEGMGM